MFATPLATHVRDSRLRPQLRLAVCHDFPSCNSTTDGRTVLTPQRHLPSVPTLTLIKNFGTFSLACSYCPPSCPPPLVALCLLTHPLAHHLLQRPLPHCQAPCPHPHFYHTLCPSLHPPCMGTCHCSFNETTPYYCRGTKLKILGHLPLPYISRRLLNVMWELDTLQNDAITVCFPSVDTTQPNSLVSLKPNSIRHLIMLRKYIGFCQT